MYGLGESDTLDSFAEESLTSIHHAIDRHVNEHSRASVRLKSVVIHGDPTERFRQLDARLSDNRVSIDDRGDHYEVSIRRVIKRSDRVVSGSFALFQHEGTKVWTALTGHDSDFFERGIEWLVRQCAPEVSEFYATSRDLESVLDSYSESIDHDAEILVTTAVGYSHRDEGEISYKTRPYPAVFREARSDGNYIDSLTFQSESESDLHLVATLTRNGATKLSSGNVEAFFSYILEDYVAFGQRKAEIFEDKERSKLTGDIEQIEIEFNKPVFQSTQDNKDLIDALLDLPQSSVTVYHKNPYAHISVLDFIDGSSCDVIVTGPKSITLVPSYRGSSNFLMRVSNKINTDLDESTVEVLDNSAYSIGDFVGG